MPFLNINWWLWFMTSPLRLSKIFSNAPKNYMIPNNDDFSWKSQFLHVIVGLFKMHQSLKPPNVCTGNCYLVNSEHSKCNFWKIFQKLSRTFGIIYFSSLKSWKIEIFLKSIYVEKNPNICHFLINIIPIECPMAKNNIYLTFYRKKFEPIFFPEFYLEKMANFQILTSSNQFNKNGMPKTS